MSFDYFLVENKLNCSESTIPDMVHVVLCTSASCVALKIGCEAYDMMKVICR